MTLRNIVRIDKEKCNGCGLCLDACAEGAIMIVDGKAELISEIYCDGLGACLGHCPQDAITIEQRDAAEFDEQATNQHLAEDKTADTQKDFVCPSMMTRQLKTKPAPVGSDKEPTPSQLSQWPIQLKLVSPNAPYFADAHLLLVADCVPFAMADFHNRFLKDKTIAVGCPKLDDVEFYIQKLSTILKANKLKSFTVIHMEVPCCFGLTHIAKQAITQSELKMAFEDVTIDLSGNVKKTENIEANN